MSRATRRRRLGLVLLLAVAAIVVGHRGRSETVTYGPGSPLSALSGLGASVATFLGAPSAANLRAVLAAATSGAFAPTVYVRTGGSDANDCLSAGAPCLTIKHAIDVGARFLNVGGASLTVDIGAGSFVESVAVNNPLTGALNIAGNPNGTNSQPGEVLLSGAGSGVTTLTDGGYCGTIIASNYAVVGVRGMRLVGNGNACTSTLFVQMAGTINIHDDVDFGPASTEHIHVENAGSQVQAWNSYTISGGAVRHIGVSNGGYIHAAYPSGVITLTGTPAFSDAFVSAAQLGAIQFNSGVTFSGSATGKRFHAYDHGIINTYASASLTYLPGSVAGTTANGIYDAAGTVKSDTVGTTATYSGAVTTGSVAASGNMAAGGAIVAGIRSYSHGVSATSADYSWYADNSDGSKVAYFRNDGLFYMGGDLTIAGVVIGKGRIVTGTTDGPTAADCGGTLHFTSGSPITVTMPNNITTLECNITFIAEGAGQITFAMASGATLRSAHSYTKTFAQWSVVGILLNTNAGGTSAVYTLSGDGA